MCRWTDPHCNSIEIMRTRNTSLLPLFNPQLIYFYHSKSINFLFRILILEILVMQMIVRCNPNRIKYLLYFWSTCHCWRNKVKVIPYFLWKCLCLFLRGLTKRLTGAGLQPGVQVLQFSCRGCGCNWRHRHQHHHRWRRHPNLNCQQRALLAFKFCFFFF